MLHARGAGSPAAALVLARRLPGLGTLLYSPAGPLVDWADRKAASDLVAGVTHLARSLGAFAWRVEPRVPESDAAAAEQIAAAGFLRLPETWSYWNRQKHEMHLSLEGGEAGAFRRIGTATRTKIRNAAKRGVVIERHSGPSAADEAYEMLVNTSRKKGTLLRSRSYFRHLIETCERWGAGMAFIGRRGDEGLCVGLTGVSGPTATGVYIASNYAERYANYLLQWEIIRWAIQQGCTVFDFGGTATGWPPNPASRGYGVYRFKRTFAAEVVAWYGYADLVLRRAPYHAFRTAERMLPYGERVLVQWPRRVAKALRPRSAEKAPPEEAVAGA